MKISKAPHGTYAKKPMPKEDLAKKGGFRSVKTFEKHRREPANYGKHPYKQK